MEFLVGAVLALSVGLSATFLGLDRDRAFYPTVMMVIASYYALFAVMGGSASALAIESIVYPLVASVLSLIRCRGGCLSRVASFAVESSCHCDLRTGCSGRSNGIVGTRQRAAAEPGRYAALPAHRNRNRR